MNTSTSQRAARLFTVAAVSSSSLLLLPLAFGRTYTFPFELAAIAFAGALAGWLGGALFTRYPSRWEATWRGVVISVVTLAATNLFYWSATSFGDGLRLGEAAMIATTGTVLFSWYAAVCGIVAGLLVRRGSKEPGNPVALPT